VKKFADARRGCCCAGAGAHGCFHCLRTVSLQHGFHSGDIVALRESGGSAKAQKTDDGSGLRGLVYRVQETRIIVAVDGDNADEVLSCA
jgi:hypothetical protein